MATTTGFLRDNDGIFIPKDENAVLTYSLEWEDWLNGDTIQSSTFTIESLAGDTDPLSKDSQSTTGTVTTVLLSGGTTGKLYKVFNTIETTGGLTERRYFRVRIEERSL